LLEKVVALWFVFPSATKTSECDTANRVGLKMQVNDGGSERCAAVVVAFNGENVAAVTALGGEENRLVGYVAARNENISMHVWQLVQQCFIVRNHEQRHKWPHAYFRGKISA